MRLFTVFAVANKPLDNSYLEIERKRAKLIDHVLITKEFGLFWMAVIWHAASW